MSMAVDAAAEVMRDSMRETVKRHSLWHLVQSALIFALTIRPFPNWAWVLLSGIVGILLAFFPLVRTPVTALWLLGVLLCIQLIGDGVALGNLAWRARQT